jgi:hypothetical protein
MDLLLIVLVVLLIFGGGFGYIIWGYGGFGDGLALGVGGGLLAILVLYVLGHRF